MGKNMNNVFIPCDECKYSNKNCDNCHYKLVLQYFNQLLKYHESCSLCLYREYLPGGYGCKLNKENNCNNFFAVDWDAFFKEYKGYVG